MNETKAKRDFDQEAAKWDENPVRVKLAEDVAQAIAGQVVFRRDMAVLDLGCGTGLLTLRLAPLVQFITGADTSQGMLDVLRAKAAQQGQAHVNIQHLKSGDEMTGAYDVIVSNMTFHHIDNIEALLQQLYAALKTPGYLCVADLDLDQGEFHSDHTGVYHFGFDRMSLSESFKKAGFAGVKVVTAAAVAKPTKKGDLRTFTIFLAVGQKV